MPVEQGVVGKAAHKLADHPFLLGRQPVGMGRIYGREIHVLHRIVPVPYPHRSGGKIYLVQQVAVRHAELLAPADYLPLQLELDNGYRLVHLGNKADRLLVEGGT